MNDQVLKPGTGMVDIVLYYFDEWVSNDTLNFTRLCIFSNRVMDCVSFRELFTIDNDNKVIPNFSVEIRCLTLRLL